MGFSLQRNHVIGYSKVHYSVDSLNLDYLWNRQSDLHENPVKLGCMVLEKSAWKSVYRIIDFTGMLWIEYCKTPP